MASCGGLVSIVLLAIFVIQVIEFGHSNASTNVSCIGVEREALLKFKHGLTDPSRRLSSWVGEECCKWEGVECNEKTGHVLKLDLHNPYTGEIYIDNFIPSSKCRLGGNIAPSLTKLKYLKYLDLSVNNFATQKIPMFFASLQKLEYLNLSYARFDGHIPRQLNNLSKLEYLDLSSDSDLGYLTSNDLDWVSKLSSLKYLHMSGVGLSKAKDWFGSINMLSSLQSLGLSNCQLQVIPSTLQANFTSLRFPDISSNYIDSSIPPWIYNLSKLEHIDLSTAFLNEGRLPTAIIENNQRIALFDMSWTFLLGEFSKNLSSLCKLQVVRLRGNNFNGNISIISNGRLGCVQSKWKIFDVSENHFGGDLPNQFGDFRELEHLDLSFNSISGSIPANLVELSSLRELYLSDNKLSGTIPESIGRLSNLKINRPVTSGIRATIGKGATEPRSDVSSQTEKGGGDDRGRAPEKQGAKAKKDRASSSSRDMVGDLETRMAKVEIAMADVQGMVEDMSARIEGGETGTGELEAEVLELKSEFGELRGEMLGNLTDTTNELQQRDNALEALVEVMHAETAELKAKVAEMEGARVNEVITV
ncbi:receptor-like protein EIX2 [Syzygium oleosum]|uniref:receptor-like protein EIX2 n=1 Tax=Syzygium oleosum TaxID=219896 RepID=UPI0024BAD33F|nr:receptor-like protein EIX2 [Syzygium oleosum]